MKTWKDFNCNCRKEDKNCPLIDLRDEAIKWIKEFNNIDGTNYVNPQCRKFDMEYDGMDLEGWIKHFFNIKESDLK